MMKSASSALHQQQQPLQQQPPTALAINFKICAPFGGQPRKVLIPPVPTPAAATSLPIPLLQSELMRKALEIFTNQTSALISDVDEMEDAYSVLQAKAMVVDYAKKRLNFNSSLSSRTAAVKHFMLQHDKEERKRVEMYRKKWSTIRDFVILINRPAEGEHDLLCYYLLHANDYLHRRYH